MTRVILTLNAGSSSVKFRLFGLEASLPALADGKVVGIHERRTGQAVTPHAKQSDRRRGISRPASGRPDKKVDGYPVFEAKSENDGAAEKRSLPDCASHEEALDVILEWLQRKGGKAWDVTVVAHRIVHGGERFAEPALLTPSVVSYLETLCPLAPLHQAHNLACVKILAKRKPPILQYGCFDTAFHARHEKLFSVFALPAEIREKGVRRYGFHGLSYDWIAQCLRRDHPRLSKGRVVVAHLGNGASLCAMKNGKGVDTTMGMSTLEGLPMGTRCGNLDPGAFIFMQRNLRLSLDQVEHILYEESGLLGLSGISNDVKTLSESHHDNARFALDYFAMKTAQYIATMAVSMGGIDGLVFTGGIGENADNVRRMILKNLGFMPPFETLVIPTNEERGMAQKAYEFYKKEKAA